MWHMYCTPPPSSAMPHSLQEMAGRWCNQSVCLVSTIDDYVPMFNVTLGRLNNCNTTTNYCFELYTGETASGYCARNKTFASKTKKQMIYCLLLEVEVGHSLFAVFLAQSVFKIWSKNNLKALGIELRICQFENVLSYNSS